MNVTWFLSGVGSGIALMLGAAIGSAWYTLKHPQQLMKYVFRKANQR